ncbi:MAG TPA: phosphatase PAP2 family protein [Saprospiraceae bacterium]|nr:phosphatase PAP2 family protein [Saprospiraceae bacterium]HPI04945.1 phosphatase PAP2 family protein [Saprospiraceae bacterium]
MMKKLPVSGKPLLVFATLLLLLPACHPDAVAPEPTSHLTASYEREVATKWNDLLLEIERFTPGYLPPVSARSFAYIGLAAYETAVPGMPEYKSLGNYYGLQLPSPKENDEYFYPAALNSAYAAMIIKLYPTAPAAQISKIITLQNYFNDKYEAQTSPEVFENSVNWGRSVAEAIYAWSKTDATGHEGYLRPSDPSYVPPSGSGLWQPTYPNFGKALLPHWGDVRMFAATSDEQCKAPLPYSTAENSEFYVQAKETENKVNLIRQGLNYEDKWIAEFWSDDCAALTFTPAGRWIAIASQALENNSGNLEKAVVVYAKVGMAVCDAGIRAWGEKYRYNVLRPVDYIRNVMGHDTWNSIMCPDGAGQFFTPSFPTYPSGHGTFSGAASEVLTTEFGSSYAMIDKCHENRVEFIGTPRSFHSFYEMAQENAYSRLPIGVHFRMDAEAALDLGYKVGRRVDHLPWK